MLPLNRFILQGSTTNNAIEKKSQQHYLSSNLTEFCNGELMKFVEFARKNITIDGFKLRAARVVQRM